MGFTVNSDFRQLKPQPKVWSKLKTLRQSIGANQFKNGS